MIYKITKHVKTEYKNGNKSYPLLKRARGILNDN